MEKETMFICRRDAKGRHTVLEATPEALTLFVAATAKSGSKASEDAALMVLANGAEVPGDGGVTWFRVQRPISFTPTPTHCHLTGGTIGDVAYDAKTKYGGWCIMSHQSWREHGCGKLGCGYGQKYRRGSDGQFYLSEGMSRRPTPYKVAA